MRRSALPGGFSLAFYLAFLSAILQYSSASLLLTPLPVYIEELGGGPAEVGLSGTIVALTALAFRPYMGRLADTRGRKPTLLIGASMYVVASLGYAVSDSIPVFLVARVIQGIGISAFTSAFGAYVADVTPPARWGEALGIAGTSMAVATMVAPPIGAALIGHLALRGIFLIAAMTALAALGVTLLLREPQKEPQTRHAGSPDLPRAIEVVRLRGVLVPSVANLTLGVAQGTFMTFLPLFVRDRGLGNAGFFFTMMSGFSIVAAFSMGRLSDRVGRPAVALPMFLILALGSGSLVWTYSFAMLLLVAAVIGIGVGGARVGLESMLVDAAPASLRGTAFGLLYLCFDIGIASGSMAGGLLASFTDYGTLYALVGVICLLTTGAFGAVTREERSSRGNRQI
ncbi:MAG TPA: MFS transporter [Chloroflexi bacterium]|nr:MFS transporter [Chloroflexota bacterium]